MMGLDYVLGNIGNMLALVTYILGGYTPSYILHTHAFWDLFIGGVIHLEKMIIR